MVIQAMVYLGLAVLYGMALYMASMPINREPEGRKEGGVA